jgi:hypothetical protein
MPNKFLCGILFMCNIIVTAILIYHFPPEINSWKDFSADAGVMFFASFAILFLFLGVK